MSSNTDPEFTDAMRNLTSQAEKRLPSDFSALSQRTGKNDFLLSVGQMIRPVAMGIEALGRTARENHALLDRIGETLARENHALQERLDAVLNNQPEAPAATTLDAIVSHLQRLGTIETANQKLFDALHAELKGYKDSFLFDALQKPFIRDLIGLFDDLTAQHAQVRKHLAETPDAPGILDTVANNLENTLFHLIEIFDRLDVLPTRTEPGAIVDKKIHRIVAFELASRREEDGHIARSTRPGFMWRERHVRSEEVVAWRWQETADDAATDSAT